MGKKKKSKIVDEQTDGSKIYGFDEPSKKKEFRDLGEANSAIKDHAKFDKFKKGMK